MVMYVRACLCACVRLCFAKSNTRIPSVGMVCASLLRLVRFQSLLIKFLDFSDLFLRFVVIALCLLLQAGRGLAMVLVFGFRISSHFFFFL